jgi:hypothetical protein
MQTGSGAALGRGNRAAGVWGDGEPRGVPNLAKLASGPCRAPLPIRLLEVYVGIDRRRSATSLFHPALRERTAVQRTVQLTSIENVGS